MYYCSNCGDYNSHLVKTSRIYEHDVRYYCEHGTHHYDIYEVYNVITNLTCNYCGYKSSFSDLEYVYLKYSN